MAIYLDDQQREYLKALLKKQPSWWVRDKIISEIEAEEKHIQLVTECKHKFAEYTGKKQSCTFCGCHNVGMGVSWKFTKNISSTAQKKLKQKITDLLPEDRF